MQILVRVFFVLLAIGGITGEVLVAHVLILSTAYTEEVICNRLGVSSMEEALKESEVFVSANSLEPNEIQELNNVMEGYLLRKQAIWFPIAAGALGLFGMALALFRKGKCAAAVLLAAAVGPALVMPLNALPSLAILTGALPAAGLLVLFIRPLLKAEGRRND